MVPAPHAISSKPLTMVSGSPKERIVISGISGTFPRSNNIKDFTNILYNKIDPVANSKVRWEFDHPEVPKYHGKVPNLYSFDAQFFKVNNHLAKCMDPMARKLLEHVYRAIYDAGLSADSFAGKNVGVFIGSSIAEFEKSGVYDRDVSAYTMPGCSKAMFANRISYWLDVKGPSMSVDDMCCTSLVAVEQAYQSILRGDCEAAIVGASHVAIHPQTIIQYARMMTLSEDCKTKSFDQTADGCAKSDAICVILLQKADVALRIYAEIVHVKSEFDGYSQEKWAQKDGFLRNCDNVATFIKKFYNEAGVPPNNVEYVEAFGCGISEVDKTELEAIEKVFCNDRHDPLLVGSVMSNIGYTEAASGLVALTKVLLGYKTGVLAANLHCSNPRQDVAALREGRMRIVTEHEPFQRSYAAINCFSVSGVNGHILLRGFYKPKQDEAPKPSIPYLVTVSGRNESSVQKVIDDLKSRPVENQELALLNNIHEEKNIGHLARGFAILDTDQENKTSCLSESAAYYDDVKRPLWFVYSGMGSQWPRMGAQLMRIPIFAAAIERCHKALAPKGLDIVHIITTDDKTIFDNILHSFVGIAAVQIGLTDVLREMGIVPDKIIGHSVGELGCAYADGCFTAEEMILSAYSRGLVSLQTEFIRGSMAAVGIGYQQAVKLCPPEIDVACHNGPESCTISGPADKMQEFVAKLTEMSIFAKEVPCSNIAYHSRYIAEAGPKLLEYLSEVIKSPKKRGERWVSTSVPQERWGEENAQYCSAWYHTNNLLSPVLFEETSKLVPPGAVLVEIAPHGLLQAILKRSLHPDCRHIPLTRRGHPDNALHMLEAFGKLFVQGYNPKIKYLYPKVEFPVSTETPALSHLVEWNNSDKWPMPLSKPVRREHTCICKFLISIHDEEHSYLQGHVVRGKTLYPYSAVLVSVWDTLAMMSGVKRKAISVQFRDVHLFTQPILLDKRHLSLRVTIHQGTGEFEVTDGPSKVATGFVNEMPADDGTAQLLQQSVEMTSEMTLDSNVIYKVLQEKDYLYSKEFRSIYKSNDSFTEAQLIWKDNWSTLVDGMIQLSALQRGYTNVSQPNHIHRLTVSLKDHDIEKMQQLDNKILIPSNVSPIYDWARCGGILMEKLRFEEMPPIRMNNLELLKSQFIPRYISSKNDSIELIEMFQIYLQIIAENIGKDNIRVLGILKNTDKLYADCLKNAVENTPGVNFTFNYEDSNNIAFENIKQADVLLIEHLLEDKNMLKALKRALKPNTFIINKVYPSNNIKTPLSELYEIVSSCNSREQKIDLAIWMPVVTTSTKAVIVQTQSDMINISATRATMSTNDKLIVISTYPPIPNLKKLVNHLRQAGDNKNLHLVLYAGKRNIENLSLDYSKIKLAFTVIKDDIVGGEYFVPWEETERETTVKEATLRIDSIGDLDSLHWVETPLESQAQNDVLVMVRYAGINVLDANVATGVIPAKQGNVGYGMDFSGITDKGERVMGIVRSGAASTYVKAVPGLTWPVPAQWTLEDAATVPLAYAQAFYCLGIKVRLFPGMSILVQGGSGALGQAIISLALAYQCRVFTTVRDASKKDFLLKLFPELTEDVIGYSRDYSFADLVLLATNGVGCDIVICCAKGELKNTTLKCGAFCGIIIDTEQAHSKDSFNYGMNYLTNQRSYMLVDFYNIFENTENVQMIQLMMSDGIARGYVKPLSRVTYAAHESTRAFRLLASSRHRGRVLLRLPRDDTAAQTRFTCSPDLYQLVVCNEEPFSIQFVDRLIKCGARNILLQNSPQSQWFFYKEKTWKKVGVNIQTAPRDKNLIEDYIQLFGGKIFEGIFFISFGDAQDCSILSNLDIVSRTMCPALKYFTVLSANENSLGELVCATRAKMQLPGCILYLPSNKVNDQSSEYSTNVAQNNLMDVIERGVFYKLGVLKVHLVQHVKSSILEKIAVIADINVPVNMNENTTLKEMGLNYSYSPAIAAFLQKSCNISIDEGKIPSLSVKLLKQFEDKIYEPDFKEMNGLASFFTQVDRDELLGVAELVTLPTMFKILTVRENMIDLNQQYLSIIPGLEGHHDRFRNLCGRLKVPALVLQPGTDFPDESVQELAQRFVKVLTERTGLNKQKTFSILGYEAGIFVAFEIAAILESKGMTGTVFCVGGTPDQIAMFLKNNLKDFTSEDAIQNAVLRQMITLLCNYEVDNIDVCFEEGVAWHKKLDNAIQFLTKHSSSSSQYSEALIEAAYNRIKQNLLYKVQPYTLKSKVVLLNTTSNAKGSTEVLSEDLVDVYELGVPLECAVQHPKCAAIVNCHLNVEDYENQNHCELLADDELFISKYSAVEEEED